jgi:hypothetical protein
MLTANDEHCKVSPKQMAKSGYCFSCGAVKVMIL